MQLKAIAETARNSSSRCWITEVNWPLWEGPHSPAGRDVAVDEEFQASYLVRYFLLTLGTGLVERVYWWQMVARGYGLLWSDDDGSLHRRAAFAAMTTMACELAGTTFLGPLASAGGGRLYRFRDRQGAELVVGWSPQGATTAHLPRPAERVLSRDGEELAPLPEVAVEVEEAPRYFWLSRE